MLLKLILERYIPLLSSGIQKVELSTDHMINLFISSSGSGKTSALKEATPFPPENGNYKEGGRKYYESREGSNHFVLDSYTHVGNGHSFKLNGKELNPNGTYQAQKELVEFHFNTSVSLERVLSGLRGIDLLSGMTPAKRKDILMEVYPNNTDYGLAVYNKMRAERNGLKATIKNQMDRYTEENRKLKEIEECGVTQLEERIKNIDEELRESLLIRGSLEQYNKNDELDRLILRFNQMVDQMAVNKLSNTFYTLPEIKSSIESMTTLFWMHHENANGLKLLISENSSGLEGLDDLLKDPDKYTHQAESNRQDILKVSSELEEHNRLLSGYPVFGDLESDLGNLEHIIEPFIGYLHRTELASSQELTGAVYKKYTQDHDKLSNEIRHHKTVLGDLIHKITHYEQSESVECPDCKHTFKVGITPQEIQTLKEQRDTLTDRIERDNQRLDDLGKRIALDADWFMGMNQLFQFIRENGHVNCLPGLIKQYNVGKVESSRLINGLSFFASKVKLQEKYKLLLEEQNLIETRIGLMDRSNVKFVIEYIAGLERELVFENNKITFYKNKLDALKRTEKQIESYNEDLKTLKELRETILDSLTDNAYVSLRGKVDHRIKLLTEEKEDYMMSLIKNRSLTAVVSSISDDIERMKKRMKIIDIWMESLCPNKGYIGRLMGDFIRTLCNKMNLILKQIWDTPLHIKPCSKENGDLTYKFPVVVGEGQPNPDVSECSAGERDIIDWVFRFVLLGYRPEGGKLVMDEVGVRLDEVKRNRFVAFIDQYTREKSPRQIFLVSHYMAQYGVFKNPNVIAFRYEGLTLPGEVNLDTVVA